MQRHLPLALLLFVSIVFVVYPIADTQGAPLQDPSKQQVTANIAKPIKKTAGTTSAPVAAKTKTINKSVPQNKLSAKTSPSVTSSAKVKQEQTARRTAPAQPDGPVAGSKKNAVVKRTQAVAQSAAPAKHPTKFRKKRAPRPAETPVLSSVPATGSLQDVDKQISSRSAIVMDAQTGEELFAKNPDAPRQPASTIKIITGMIALKSLKNGDIIDVSDKAAGMPSSKIFLDPDKQYQANDLINAVLLASANDASVALAEKIAGSEDKFANLMTLSARMWGARNTVCRTASGLTALGQQSTARDLANLFRYAMQHDEFARRMREKSISTSYGKTLRNHNKALWRLDGALGGKTGYTVAARQTYVGQFSRDNRTIVVAIMGSESMWADLEKLVTYGFRKEKKEQLARIGSNDSASGRAARVY
jgi:D-alanyl-D-alanine carboxypeptidase (penicillin-binding protein 5/6)